MRQHPFCQHFERANMRLVSRHKTSYLYESNDEIYDGVAWFYLGDGFNLSFIDVRAKGDYVVPKYFGSNKDNTYIRTTLNSDMYTVSKNKRNWGKGLIFNDKKTAKGSRFYFKTGGKFLSLCLSLDKEKIHEIYDKEGILIDTQMLFRDRINLQRGISFYAKKIMQDPSITIRDDTEYEFYALQMLEYTIKECKSLKEEDRSTILGVKDYIEKNNSLNIKIDDICYNFYLSRSSLQNKFKKTTGMTITEYVQDKKIQKAQNLLQDSELSIQDIATMSGYQSHSTFSKIFRRTTGLTPNKWRIYSRGIL